MNVDQLDRRIAEIEQELLRTDPTLDQQFAKLDPGDRWHDAAVFTLLAASAVFLMIGLSTMSIVAWFAGATSVIAAFTIDARHEREMRAARRSAELGLAPDPAIHRPEASKTATTDWGDSR